MDRHDTNIMLEDAIYDFVSLNEQRYRCMIVEGVLRIYVHDTASQFAKGHYS